MRAASIVFTSSLLLLPLVASPALATWPALGRSLDAAIKDQQGPRAATDGADGAIVVWQDFRSPLVNIFARRVLASGELDPAWPVDGSSLLADSTALATAFDGQQLPVIVSDGAGGAIVAWQDGRNQLSNFDVFAQHILGSGVVDPAWPANGRALCTVRGDQSTPKIISDGAGGAIVTWMDSRSGITGVDIFAQHVLASGAVDPRWPVDGIALCTAPADQALPEIATDGSGGAIVTWYDFRPSASNVDVYAQRVLNSGVVDPAWPVNGRALSLAAGTQINPAIVSDGAHGAIVSWEDRRDGFSHIYAQRVISSSAIATGWPADGLTVSIASGQQFEPILVSDGSGGAIISWLDTRDAQNPNPFAQHVRASGTVDSAWPVNGSAVGLSAGKVSEASMVSDGAGGAIVAWEEDAVVLTNHIQASGVLDPTFPTSGRSVRLLQTVQQSPDLVSSGSRNAIVAWSDQGASLDFDIYAQLVETGGAVDVSPGGTPAPAISFASPSPNPAFGAVTLRFSLPRSENLSLAIFDAGGRRVRALASGIQPGGQHVVEWDLRDDSGNATGSGIYFARLAVEGSVFTKKVVRAH